jgi:hypothetical protein
VSHFSCIVRVPGTTPEAVIPEAVARLMAPYEETTKTEAVKPHLVFNDIEDEYLEKYRAESSSQVRLADGSVFSTYDNQFRNPQLFQLPQYIYPAGSTLFEVPHVEQYPTFEQFMADYCGFDSRDEKKGRYGYWKNSQQKWDWYAIGGRWSGFFLLGYDICADRRNYETCFICGGTGTRPGCVYEDDAFRQPTPAGHPVIGTGCNSCHGTGFLLKSPSSFAQDGNYVRARELSLIDCRREAMDRLSNFWGRWQDYIRDGGDDDNVREQALALGILQCKNADELTGPYERVIPWDKPDTPPEERRNRFDVLLPVTFEWLCDHCEDYFSPIASFARLDANGWQEKGEMGCFGFSSATPESRQEFNQSLWPWIMSGDQNDWLVCVDCHT